VQVRIFVGQLFPLHLGPHHERVHRPPDPLLLDRLLLLLLRHLGRLLLLLRPAGLLQVLLPLLLLLLLLLVVRLVRRRRLQLLVMVHVEIELRTAAAAAAVVLQPTAARRVVRGRLLRGERGRNHHLGDGYLLLLLLLNVRGLEELAGTVVPVVRLVRVHRARRTGRRRVAQTAVQALVVRRVQAAVRLQFEVFGNSAENEQKKKKSKCFRPSVVLRNVKCTLVG